VDNTVNAQKYPKSSIGTQIDAEEKDLEVIEKYNWIGWFFITFFGTTQNPYYLGFKCKKTGELFAEITDKKEIAHYMLYRKK
jgi:hypothetical protein|tara:strand:- start:313 stop:558 length:246 start_codon:yes stop_codon:yes gene_type:complete